MVEAEKALNDAKQRHQKELTERLNEAKRLSKEGKIDEAVKLVQEVAQIDKTAAQPVMNEVSQVAKNAGWDALSKGDYKTAIKRLDQAVALNPADTDAQNKLKEYNKLNRWYNELIQKTNAELTRLTQAKDWAKAEALLTDVLKYEHTEANKKNYESALQIVKNNIIKEAQVQKQREIEAQKKATADKLWNECVALSKQNRLNEALEPKQDETIPK